MSLKYLLDEHIPHALTSAIARLEPSLTVSAIGDATAPPCGTLDPQLLEWCESEGFVLITNNRRSMPVHLADHLARGHHVPGIFVITSGWSLSQIAEHLVLVALASFDDEYRDQIRNLPIR